MTIWIIEPRDPLIVRDGRPFGPNPGARAKSLDFPYPSTVVGGFRSRAGKDADGFFDINKRPDVKKIGIRGPLLVELKDNDDLCWLVPTPADALLLREDDVSPVYRHHLQPLTIGGALSNLSAGLKYPVGLIKPDLKKPYKGAPHYWYWEKFTEWLTSSPSAPEPLDNEKMMELGHNGPGKEWRIHVAINADTLTGEDGALFATSGLEFWQRPSSDQLSLSQTKRLGLATDVDNLNGLTLYEGAAPWGGERRTMRWHKNAAQLPLIPDGLVESIAQTGCCRLILLTPAYFTDGWRPSWLLQAQHGVTPMLEAALVSKPQTVSGWDFEIDSAKPTRHLVPAGSVYFLRLGSDAAVIEQWVKNIWLTNVSDTVEDRLIGFGLAAIGVWSGDPQTVEVNSD